MDKEVVHTKLLGKDGTETEIGSLLDVCPASQREDLTQSIRRKKDGQPYIFISHTNHDGEFSGIPPEKIEEGIKELFARPTKWFLETVLSLGAFLDAADASGEKHIAMTKPAHECSHALIILTPSFRQREYTVRELNTFMQRATDETDHFRPVIALWNVDHLRDFAPCVNNYIWVKANQSEGVSAPEFLVSVLWQFLVKEFCGPGRAMAPELLVDKLVEYVTEERGEQCHPPVPTVLKEYVQQIQSETILKECLKPPLDHRMLLKSYTRDFVAGTRRWFFEKFEAWLANNNSQFFVLVAAEGMGKTTLAAKLVKDYPDNVVAHHFWQYDSDEKKNPRRFLLSLAVQMAKKLPTFATSLSNVLARAKEPHETTQMFRSRLQDETSLVDLCQMILADPLSEMDRDSVLDQHLFVVIDALDEVETDNKNKVVDCICHHFPKLPRWLRFVVTTRPEKPYKDRLSKFHPLWIHGEDHENRDDIRLYVQERIGKCNTDPSQLEETTVALLEKLGGTFLNAKLCLDELEHATAPISRDAIIELPLSLADVYYSEMRKRVFPEELYENQGLDYRVSLEWQIVELVFVATTPLKLQDLTELLSLPVHEVRKSIEKLSVFLECTGEAIRFPHKTVHDWLLTDKTGHFIVSEPNCHANMGNRCLAKLTRWLQEEASFSHHDSDVVSIDDTKLYQLRYTVQHLMKSDQKPLVRAAEDLVLNGKYIMSRSVLAKDIPAFVNECFSLAESATTRTSTEKAIFPILGRALRQSQNALQRGSKLQLAGQLIGRLRHLTGNIINPMDSSTKQLVCRLVHELREKVLTVPWWCPITSCWESPQDSCEQVLTGHSHNIYSVAWSPDGHRLASGSYDKTVRVWNATTGECEQVLTGHSDGVWSVAWSPDGHRLASVGSSDNTVRVWNATTGECEQVLRGHSDDVRSVAWSPDGHRLASGSWDNTVLVWNATTGECEQVLTGHSDEVWAVAWSPDGHRLASGSDDKTVRVWNATTGECEQVLTGHSNDVIVVAWSPDGHRLASGSYDNTVRVWNATTGECEQVLTGHSNSVDSVAWSPDGHRLASGSEDNTLRVWNATTGECEQVLTGHSHNVYSVAWSPDGHRLASGSYDYTVRVWNAGTGESEQMLTGHSSSVDSVAWSPDGHRLASVGSWDKTVRVWNATTGECEQVLRGHSDDVRSVAWSPDSHRLASGSWDNTVLVWNATTGECEQVLTGHSDDVRSVAWSPDGHRLASGSDDKTVRVWNATTGECEQVLTGHSDSVDSVAWSPDGRRIASKDWLGNLLVFDLSQNVSVARPQPVESVPWETDSNSNNESSPIDTTIVGVDCEVFSSCGRYAVGVYNKRQVCFFELIQPVLPQQ